MLLKALVDHSYTLQKSEADCGNWPLEGAECFSYGSLSTLFENFFKKRFRSNSQNR